MSLNSPNGKLFLAVQERLQQKVTGLNWIDQNFGQLDGYELKPPVKFPCALIDITGLRFDDNSNGQQTCTGSLVISLSTAPFTQSNPGTPVAQKEKALEYYELEWAIHKALHNWIPVTGMQKLLRRSLDKQEREDTIRERVIVFNCGYVDRGAVAAKQTVSNPEPSIGGDMLTPA